MKYSKKEIRLALQESLNDTGGVIVPGIFDLDDEVFIEDVITRLKHGYAEVILAERARLEEGWR